MTDRHTDGLTCRPCYGSIWPKGGVACKRHGCPKNWPLIIFCHHFHNHYRDFEAIIFTAVPSTVIHYYPAPGRGAGYCFRAISLVLCQQHYEKTAGPICMKFSGKVWSDHGTTWLNFGSIRVLVNGSIYLLSPAIAQRTGVNKSVSYARWQQGAGFVVPRTTACII